MAPRSRRSLLRLGGAALPIALGGCTGSSSSGKTFPSPEEDSFPLEIDGWVRGGADDVITVTTSNPGDLWEDSAACGFKISEALEEHLRDEFGDPDGLSVSYQHNSFDVEVTYPLAVTFLSAKYDREGELTWQSPLEFAEIVETTSPTGFLVSTADEIQCSLPIYLGETTSHED